MVFIHFYLTGHSRTRELLQSYRKEAHAAIRKRLDINLFYTNTLGDTITVVTGKAEQHQGEWITTGDIRVTFPSGRAARTTYEQQMNQQQNKDTQGDRLLGHTRQVCPILKSTGYIGEISQDGSLHNAFVACTNFRGNDNNSVLQLFRDCLRELYVKLYDINANHINHPEELLHNSIGRHKSSKRQPQCGLRRITHP